MMQSVKTAIFSILLLTLSPSGAALNKWTDAQGNVHYGDSVPRGAKQQEIDTTTMSSMDSQASNKGMQELSKSFDAKRELKQRQKQRQASEDKQKQKQQKICNDLRYDLKIMRQQVRVYTENNDGTRTYLSDEQRKKDIIEAQSALKKHCS